MQQQVAQQILPQVGPPRAPGGLARTVLYVPYTMTAVVLALVNALHSAYEIRSERNARPHGHPLAGCERHIVTNVCSRLAASDHPTRVVGVGERNGRYHNLYGHVLSPVLTPADVVAEHARGNFCRHTLQTCDCLRAGDVLIMHHVAYYLSPAEIAEALITTDKPAYITVHRFPKFSGTLCNMELHYTHIGPHTIHMTAVGGETFQHNAIHWLTNSGHVNHRGRSLCWNLKYSVGDTDIFKLVMHRTELPTSSAPQIWRMYDTTINLTNAIIPVELAAQAEFIDGTLWLTAGTGRETNPLPRGLLSYLAAQCVGLPREPKTHRLLVGRARKWIQDNKDTTQGFPEAMWAAAITTAAATAMTINLHTETTALIAMNGSREPMRDYNTLSSSFHQTAPRAGWDAWLYHHSPAFIRTARDKGSKWITVAAGVLLYYVYYLALATVEELTKRSDSTGQAATIFVAIEAISYLWSYWGHKNIVRARIFACVLHFITYHMPLREGIVVHATYNLIAMWIQGPAPTTANLLAAWDVYHSHGSCYTQWLPSLRPYDALHDVYNLTGPQRHDFIVTVHAPLNPLLDDFYCAIDAAAPYIMAAAIIVCTVIHARRYPADSLPTVAPLEGTDFAGAETADQEADDIGLFQYEAYSFVHCHHPMAGANIGAPILWLITLLLAWLGAARTPVVIYSHTTTLEPGPIRPDATIEQADVAECSDDRSRPTHHLVGPQLMPTPTILASNATNEYVGATRRVAPDGLPTMDEGEFAKFSAWAHEHYSTIFHKKTVRPMPYEAWASRFSAATRSALDAARAMWRDGVDCTRESMLIKFFTKMELGFKPVDALGATATKPRIISSASPYYNCIVGPYVAAVQVSLKRTHHRAVRLGEFLREKIGSWFGRHIQWRALECDFSTFDATQHAKLRHLIIDLWQANHTMPKNVSVLMHKRADEKRGYGTHGTKIKVPGTMASGDPDTYIGNTVLNILVQTYAYTVATGQTVAEALKNYTIIAAGDDSLSFDRLRRASVETMERTISALGMSAKFVQHNDPSDTLVSFCSSYFMPVNGTWFLSPKPGRILAKLPWVSGAPSKCSLAQLRGNALGIWASVQYTPFAREYVARILNLTRGINTDAVRTEYQHYAADPMLLWSQLPALDDDTSLWMFQHYHVDSAEYQAYIKEISALQLGQVTTSNHLSTVINLDLELDC